MVDGHLHAEKYEGVWGRCGEGMRVCGGGVGRA